MLLVGVDMVEIARIEKSLKSPRFLHRCFSGEEMEQYYRTGANASYIAGCFCAKEAFAKALGTGLRGFRLCEVSALRDKLGKPCLFFTGKAAALAAGVEFELSITHTAELALAFVVGRRITAQANSGP